MIASQRIQDRVVEGKKLEKAIFDKLCESGFNLQEPSNQDDMLKKVDAWLNKDGKKVGVQIKARETGNDLLFEVYDTFVDFKNTNNKIGRDMIGSATLYAVKINNEIVVIDKKQAEEAIWEMVEEARCNGWTEHGQSKTLHYQLNNHDMQLKLQQDPSDGRKKMVAYIPADFFSVVKKVAA